MKQYHDLCRHVLANGEIKGDRTGTGTLSVFGYQMRYDLSKGFPLMTTKKLHIKSIVHELLWFLNGDTNIKYLQDNGVSIWNEWRMPYTLDREILFIEPKQAEYVPYNGDFSYKGADGKEGSIERKLCNVWLKMMRRCYDESHHRYNLYGAKGVSVSKDWHDPKKFIEDVQTIPHWYYKQNNWNEFELDKDYFGANQYGKETCVWVHTSENNMYTKTSKPIVVTNTEGISEFFLTLNEASRKLGIPSSTLSRFVNNGVPKVVKSQNKHYLGWNFNVYEADGKLPRLKLIDDGELGPIYSKQWRSWSSPNGETIDQISNVVNSIKNDPNSRRHMVVAYNPADVPDMALPPCHCLFQFYVSTDGKLSCQLYQRSADIFLGVPFNIASYALLTHMIAHQCSLEVGEFIHTLGDAHIYCNHIEQVKEQLRREPRELPQLVINRKPDSLFDYKFEDFDFIGYDPFPAIKGKVSV